MPSATVVVEGTYEIGMQDQAFLGLEAAMAIPDDDGLGVELYIATQWLHEDRKQIAACLGLPEEKVRLVLGGVGGAFGAREDISLQVHTCLLALRLGRPVRIAYSRAESFLGHVHRHPASIWMRHHATAHGVIVKIEARFVLDGGAYASTSSAVLVNAISQAQGPYKCPNAFVDGWVVRTNHVPCGAMRGFGVVQACFAHEGQMDRLAAACGLDPVAVRLRNAMETGDALITGQVVESVAPVTRCITEAAALPMPATTIGIARDVGAPDPMCLPGGAGLTADVGHVRRGVGFGVAIKNLMYSEGFDDSSTARCQLADGVATLKFATAEVGQGFVTIAQQIARTVLGVDTVVLDPIDTQIGSAGSTSASRQTWMSGGAVDAACRRRPRAAVRARRRGARHRPAAVRHRRRGRRRLDGRRCASPSPTRPPGCTSTRPSSTTTDRRRTSTRTARATATRRSRSSPTAPSSTSTRELGLVKVVQVATAQDVGRALNPLSVLGQIEGGISQGLGLAVMEEIVQIDGHIRNASFTDYLLPTFLDMPDVVATLDRGARSAGPARCQGRRRAAVHLGHAGHRRGDPRRPASGRRRRQTDRSRAGAPGGHRPVTPERPGPNGCQVDAYVECSSRASSARHAAVRPARVEVRPVRSGR